MTCNATGLSVRRSFSPTACTASTNSRRASGAAGLPPLCGLSWPSPNRARGSAVPSVSRSPKPSSTSWPRRWAAGENSPIILSARSCDGSTIANFASKTYQTLLDRVMGLSGPGASACGRTRGTRSRRSWSPRPHVAWVGCDGWI